MHEVDDRAPPHTAQTQRILPGLGRGQVRVRLEINAQMFNTMHALIAVEFRVKVRARVRVRGRLGVGVGVIDLGFVPDATQRHLGHLGRGF